MLFGLFKKRAKLQQSDVPAQTTPKNQTEFGDSFGKCGRNARWKYDATDYSFVISGEGAIEQFENINDYHRRTMHDPHNLGPWYDNPGFSSSSIPAAITEITIPEGITRIESMAFLGFKSLKTITLPKSIEHISESAFLRTKDMVFLVQNDSLAETIVDSMGWNKSYYSNAEATDNEKRNSGQSTEGQQTDTMHKKNLSVIDSYDEDEESLTVDAAVKSLRKQIIARITKSPTVEYLLFRLLWQDAASCFPERGFGWDLAEFNLDLQTGKLLANVSTYPNQFGASYEDVISLSASEFNRIAKQYNMSPELQAFKSDEDWNQLFDDNLKSAVSSACAIQQKQKEERKAAETKQYSVKIPASYTNRSPDMGLSELTIEISQRYANRSIQVTNKNGKYQVVYVRVSHTALNSERHSRVLSVAEAVWLEKQIENTIMNPDVSTWQSLVGGDTMNIEIKGNNVEAISLRGAKPIRKYSDLQDELENLAQYGYSIVGDNTVESEVLLTETAATLPKAQTIEEFPENMEQLVEIVKREDLSMLICHLDNESKGFIFDHRRQPNDTILRKFSDTRWDVYYDIGFGPKKENIHHFDTQQKACKKALVYARAANKFPNKPSTETREHLLHWNLDASGTLTISGNGPMASVHMPEYRIIDAEDLAFEQAYGDWSLDEGDVDGNYTLPWDRVDGIKVQRVIVEAGLTTVSYSAFSPFCTRINSFFPCKYDSLKEILLPDTIEVLEGKSIFDCPVLEKAVIPASVTKIHESKLGAVFDRCPNLTIHTPKGSYAESFAKQHGITVVSAEEDSSTPHHMAKTEVKSNDTDKKFRKPLVEKKLTPPKEKPKAKWQAVYDAAASLHIFKEVNERYLQGDGYKKIIEVLSEKYHSLDIVDQTNPQWKESSRELSITGAYEEWVGHDDTLSESIEMKFKRLHPWEWDEPPEWSAESDWPCEGEFQYLNESKNEGNNWNYFTMRHKAWMLKAPFGLPGVWSFEYISKSDRS